MSAAAATGSLDGVEVLVALAPDPPLAWEGTVVSPAAAGPLCTERPTALTIWAPGARWADAFRLLAMCKSAPPEQCLVVTDHVPALEWVPEDGRMAVVAGDGHGTVHAGSAPYACRDLRGERIFRWLLNGRVRRQPELERLLRLHRLAVTAHGRLVLGRWAALFPVLFASGLPGMMPAGLRRDLTAMAEAARLAEHAFTGGFHLLDPFVRGPADWEAGARTYLPLAAAQSPDAAAEVERWLAATEGWEREPAPVRQQRRLAAARMLHRLVDDPWADADKVIAAALGDEAP